MIDCCVFVLLEPAQSIARSLLRIRLVSVAFVPLPHVPPQQTAMPVSLLSFVLYCIVLCCIVALYCCVVVLYYKWLIVVWGLLLYCFVVLYCKWLIVVWRRKAVVTMSMGAAAAAAEAAAREEGVGCVVGRCCGDRRRRR